jgi:hypothetical protein
MVKSDPQLTKPFLNKGFLLTIGILAVVAVVARPLTRWGKAQYDAYKNSTTNLIASPNLHKEILATIQSSQTSKAIARANANSNSASEKTFQAALLPDILGRSSRYEPYTSNGRLACARMVNMVLDRALGYQFGQNTLFVPSIVEDLDRGKGKRLEQQETIRGDIAISNGTDYTNGQWHIGICMTDGCNLVLSNSPFKSEFSWLTNANFDGAFDQYPGKTTFYRIKS